jgi:hypothetical protein
VAFTSPWPYRLYEWKKGVDADCAAIAAKLEELAELGCVGITPHQVAVGRALARGRQRDDRQDGRNRGTQGA